MTKKIQDGERQGGKRDFQGFVFEGKASESLTCNAIEWIYSFGGGTVVDSKGKVTINNPNAIKPSKRLVVGSGPSRLKA